MAATVAAAAGLTVGVAACGGGGGSGNGGDTGMLLGTLPLVVVFVLFGPQIIGGMMEGGVK